MANARRLSSPAPQEDDDLLSEILLRLPPQPSSLTRASFVSPRWRRLISDPAFLRRFRARHHGSPSLLGCFFRDQIKNGTVSLFPTMDPPNHVPGERLSFQIDRRFVLLSCHHGLVLAYFNSEVQLLVCDPVTGDHHRVDDRTGFRANSKTGVVLRADDAGDFQVVLVGFSEDQTAALASTYSSRTGQWTDPISAPVPPNSAIIASVPGVLLGDSVYWLLAGGDSDGFLEFDSDRQSLTVIQIPKLDLNTLGHNCVRVMRVEGGGIGFFFLSGFTLLLWKRKNTGSNRGVASWELVKVIELDKLLSLSEKERGFMLIKGFAEDSNAVFLWTSVGLFMVYLDTLQFKKLQQNNCPGLFHPFTSVYAKLRYLECYSSFCDVKLERYHQCPLIQIANFHIDPRPRLSQIQRERSPAKH